MEIEFDRMIGRFVETHDHASLQCRRRKAGEIPTGLLRYARNDDGIASLR